MWMRNKLEIKAPVSSSSSPRIIQDITANDVDRMWKSLFPEENPVPAPSKLKLGDR